MLVLDIHSQGNIREHIAHLQAKLGDMTEPLVSIGMELESRISARFESRTDPSGDPWEPWA
ncbi:MAG: phage virion morphogenesis protein, partial [Comamonas sp.]|nr:phage virion morphogenesis protein [Comamonas sp.]